MYRNRLCAHVCILKWFGDMPFYNYKTLWIYVLFIFHSNLEIFIGDSTAYPLVPYILCLLQETFYTCLYVKFLTWLWADCISPLVVVSLNPSKCPWVYTTYPFRHAIAIANFYMLVSLGMLSTNDYIFCCFQYLVLTTSYILSPINRRLQHGTVTL